LIAVGRAGEGPRDASVGCDLANGLQRHPVSGRQAKLNLAARADGALDAVAAPIIARVTRVGTACASRDAQRSQLGADFCVQRRHIVVVLRGQRGEGGLELLQRFALCRRELRAAVGGGSRRHGVAQCL
jgi:hypothetical protein